MGTDRGAGVMATASGEAGDMREQILTSVAPMVVAMVASKAMSKALAALWSRRRGVAPPTAPASGEPGWAGALAWAAGLGAAAGVTKLLVRREAQQRLEKRAFVRRSSTAT